MSWMNELMYLVGPLSVHTNYVYNKNDSALYLNC